MKQEKKKKRGFKILTQIFIPNVLLNHMQVLPVPDPGHSENNAGNSIFHWGRIKHVSIVFSPFAVAAVWHSCSQNLKVNVTVLHRNWQKKEKVRYTFYQPDFTCVLIHVRLQTTPHNFSSARVSSRTFGCLPSLGHRQLEYLSVTITSRNLGPAKIPIQEKGSVSRDSVSEFVPQTDFLQR